MTDTPGLEERVAALEEAIRFPLKSANFPPMSDEDVAKFREEFEAASGQPYRILPQPAPLTPGEIRQLLRECVTVVKPGETLILRVPWRTTPNQVSELQRVLDAIAEYRELPFKVIVLPGDELTIAEASGAA